MSKPKNKQNNPKEKTDTVLNLNKHLTLEPKYECEKCGVYLALFPNYEQIDPMTRGPVYICPKCNDITDMSLKKGMHADEIKPIEISPPTIVFVPERSGIPVRQVKDYDPEPQEEERLKNMGATIIDKKVEARRDY